MNETPLEIPLPQRRTDRPVTFTHRVELGFVLLLTGFFKVLGIDTASFVSGKFLRIVGPLIRPVSRRAEDNIRKSFPDWSEEKIKATTKDVWENLGRTAAEFSHLEQLKPNLANGRVELINENKLRTLTDNGGNAIFFSGHFANWEVLPTAFQSLGIDQSLVYRAANNPLTDEYIIKRRAKVMTRHQIPKGKRGNRAIIETLSNNRSLLMLTDQKLNSGISVPFLGRPAMTLNAAARLALKYNIPLVPVSIDRLGGARFKVEFHDPLPINQTGKIDDDIYTLTKSMNEALEKFIRERPGQWLWFHRRWPKGT
ncbi:lysophospholipid acyltransferase family protein [Hyphococcus sp. DH-69]|uniref:lysophospholipid acyltransferase family protein n=1 Tax=Hyphococcus formosus TaxID=3143534 RepID=UPI00398A9AFF